MEEITAYFSKYKTLLQVKVQELTTSINAFDDALSGHTNGRISNKPNLHLLHHLLEDIERFATAIHFETEKGEQFNKFTREHIFHTNRKLPSRDVLVPFGQQFMLRHIVDGGSWTAKSGERIQAGNGIRQFWRQTQSSAISTLGAIAKLLITMRLQKG